MISHIVFAFDFFIQVVTFVDFYSSNNKRELIDSIISAVMNQNSKREETQKDSPRVLLRGI